MRGEGNLTRRFENNPSPVRLVGWMDLQRHGNDGSVRGRGVMRRWIGVVRLEELPRERVGGGGWLPAAAVRKRKTNVGRGREGKGWNGRACCAFSFFFFFR